MVIQEKALQHWLDNFYGYGSWHAPIWFIEYEEGGGDTPEEVAEKLNYFNTAHGRITSSVLCDIREMYRQVSFRTEGPKAVPYASLFEYRFGGSAVLHGSWKNLIAFVHGYEGRKLPDLLKYQQHSFATTSEALIRLYPLPSPHNHAWYYSWLGLPHCDFLKTRKAYEGHVYTSRMQNILHNIRALKPAVVVLYGMNNINTLKQSAQAFFPTVKFKMVKAIKQQIPQHHRADIDGTTVLITTQIPALRHNRKETGFDWLEFGKAARS